MSLREAAQQALEALEKYDRVSALEFLRTALAEPEQEPVAWMWPHQFEDMKQLGGSQSIRMWPKENFKGLMPLYTHPPQRKPLTDEEIELLAVKHAPPIDPAFAKDDDFIEFARAIERAHGIGVEQ